MSLRITVHCIGFLLSVLVANMSCEVFNYYSYQTLTDVDCKKEASQYICTTRSGALRQKWFQTYDYTYTIGNIPRTSTTKMKLCIKLELFDNNTLVILTTEHGKYKIWSKKLLVKADDKIEDHKVRILKYSEASDIQFSCQEYVDQGYYIDKMHVGFINTTNNKIKTFKGISIKKHLFNMADNGTILCCLYYTTKDVGTEELHVERFVEKKTLLIYQPKSTANLTDTKEQTTSNSQNNWLILTTSIGTFILLLLLYMIMKKIWRTDPQPGEQTVELENNAPQNEVLYADLDFVTRVKPPRSHNEESDYATIVGALHPL